MDMLIIGVIAVLLFGKRLPEVGRSVGKGLLEFKKGLRGIEEELHKATYAVESSPSRSSAGDEAEDREEATAPKFEPPPEEAKSEPAQA
jgi:sec-independent protein translocase protein TatA